MFKKTLIIIFCFSLSFSPIRSHAGYEDTLKLFEQVKTIEVSAGDIFSKIPALRQTLDLIYQGILELLKADLAELLSPKTTAVSFTLIQSPLSRGSLQTISFTRTPAGTHSPIDFVVETAANNLLVGSLSNSVIGNNITWQVADNFVVGRSYQIAARARDGSNLGRSSVFTVSSSTSMTTPSQVNPEEDNKVGSSDINYGSIGFWSFDRFSSSCDTRGGALTNAEGKFGSALSLNGLDSYCIVRHNKLFYPKHFTLALWAKSDPSSSSWNNSGWFVSLRDQSGFNIGPVKDSKNVQFTILDDSNPAQKSYVVGTVSPDNITDWHHYAMTYDGMIAKVYLDGVLAISTTTNISRNYVGENKDMYFGFDNIPGQPIGAGALDEIRLYDRPMTACEIRYLAGKGCAGIASLQSVNTASAISAIEAVLEKFRAGLK